MIRHFLALSLTLAACATASAPAPAATSGRAGTIVKITEGIWAITPADRSTERYCFDGALATPALHVEGKKVLFSGTPGTIPPNVRMACTPFALTAVSSAE